MPRAFLLSINGSYYGEYTCRESVGSIVHDRLHGIDSFVAYRDALMPASIVIVMECATDNLPGLQKLLKESMVSSFDLALEAKDSWFGDSGVRLILSGAARDVYWDMWWAILIMRLVAVDGCSANTVAQLIDESSQDDDNWFNEDSDAAEALYVWRNYRNDVDIRNTAFVYGSGPVSAVNRVADYKKLREHALHAGIPELA